MSDQGQPNPYFFPPRYTQQSLHKGGGEGLSPVGYRDWRKWSLARDGAGARFGSGKPSKTRMGGAAVQDGGVKKSKKRASTILEVQGKLYAKAAEYATSPVLPAEADQEEMMEVGSKGQG